MVGLRRAAWNKTLMASLTLKAAADVERIREAVQQRDAGRQLPKEALVGRLSAKRN